MAVDCNCLNAGAISKVLALKTSMHGNGLFSNRRRIPLPTDPSQADYMVVSLLIQPLPFINPQNRIRSSLMLGSYYDPCHDQSPKLRGSKIPSWCRSRSPTSVPPHLQAATRSISLKSQDKQREECTAAIFIELRSTALVASLVFPCTCP
jgi:hypothetical protein